MPQSGVTKINVVIKVAAPETVGVFNFGII